MLQAYEAARQSGKDEAGDVLLVLTDKLSKVDFKDTFVDEFGVRTTSCLVAPRPLPESL